jgi:hypothetical protein
MVTSYLLAELVGVTINLYILAPVVKNYREVSGPVRVLKGIGARLVNLSGTLRRRE